MHTLLLFTGDIERDHADDETKCKVRVQDCWPNWEEALVNDLTSKGHTVSVALQTYECDALKRTIELMKPRIVEINPRESAVQRMVNVCRFLSEIEHGEYDRVVFCRFDITYRHRITEWPTWNKQGIHILNRNAGWVSRDDIRGPCGDGVHMIDKPFLQAFVRALMDATPISHDSHFILFPLVATHNLTVGETVHFMYDSIHHFHAKHPLIVPMMFKDRIVPELDAPLDNVIYLCTDGHQWREETCHPSQLRPFWETPY